jgi:hypothetical protein
MSDAVYVEEASQWACLLINRESKGSGDTENAMRRIEARYGIPFATLWSLRYRRPKAIVTSLYFRLHAAYQQECQRQMRLLRHELEITKAIAGADRAAVREVQSLVDEADGDCSRGDHEATRHDAAV